MTHPCQGSTGSGAEQERVGVPRTAQVRLGWLIAALKPRVLNQPLLQAIHFLTFFPPAADPDSGGLRGSRSLKATRSRHSGDQLRTLTRQQACTARACRSWLLQEASPLQGAREAFVATNEAVLKENQGQAGLLCFLSVRPESLGSEQALRMLAGNKSAWRTGAGSAE